MSISVYTIDDLWRLAELSDQRFMCFALDQQWRLMWASDRLWKDLSTCAISQTERDLLQLAYTQTLSTITLKHKQYQVSYKVIQIETQMCVLFSLTLIPPADPWILNEQRMNILPCGIFMIHVDGNKLSCAYNNTYFYQMLGYADGELQKDDMLTTNIIYPDDFDKLKEEIFQHIHANDALFELEYRVVCKNGDIRWMMARVVLDIVKNNYLAIVLDNTKRKEMLNQLRIREEEKRIALQQGNVFILRYDVKQHILHITDDGILSNEKYRDIPNVPEMIIGKDIVAEETQKEFLQFFQEMQKGQKHGEAIFKQRLFPYREFRWIKAKYTMIYDDDGEAETAIISYEDFSEFHEKELAYEKWKINFERRKAETIAYYDYDMTNDKFEALQGKMNDVLPHDQRHSFTYIAHYAADHFVASCDRQRYLRVFSREYLLKQYQQGNQHITLEHRRMKEDGTTYWALGDIYLIWDPYASIVKASVLLFDIDDEKRKNIELKRLSETDALTGLYNRNSLFRRMENSLQHSGKHVLHMMVLIDLDHFKDINDTYGHQYGDMCLKKVAQAMRSSCRGEDICSRIGGDEFVVFMRNMSPATDVAKKLEDLRNAICMPDQQQLPIRVSIGAACYPDHGEDVSTLYRHADEAMYHAKHKGRNQCFIYGLNKE